VASPEGFAGNAINIDREESPYIVWNNTDKAFSTVMAGSNLGVRSYADSANGVENLVDGTIFSGAVPTAVLAEGIELDYVGEKDVIFALLGKTLPSDVFDGYNSGIYPVGTMAYKFGEMLLDSIFIAPWDAPDENGFCEFGAHPEPSTGICNSLPTAMGSDNSFRAKTLSDFTYPSGYDSTQNFVTATHLGSGSDRAMVLSDNGEIHIYPEPVYQRDQFGEIIAAEPFDRGQIVAVGSWTERSQPFIHYDLDLPQGYEYQYAQGDFHKGTPILFEQQGLLRNGWTVFAGAYVADILGFDDPRILLNSRAANRTLGAIERAGILATQPIDD
jgi:hypothetical protein